jgi:aspartyl-tRNA(Asn)/glutamyl-tRNA(Gln) amidotransferase subunit A
MSIAEAGARFRRRELTSQKLAEGYFACIERFEPKLNAFRLKLRESALKTAVERDSGLRQGKDRVPLHGIPLLTNDMFEMAGTVTTFGRTPTFRGNPGATRRSFESCLMLAQIRTLLASHPC